MGPSSPAFAPTATELQSSATARSARLRPSPALAGCTKSDPTPHPPPAPPARPPVSQLPPPPPPPSQLPPARPSDPAACRAPAAPYQTKWVRFAFTASTTPPRIHYPSAVSRSHSATPAPTAGSKPPSRSCDRIEDEDLEGWTTIRRRRGRATRAGLGCAPAVPRLLSAHAPSRLMVSL
jgi:hypothetical protein